MTTEPTPVRTVDDDAQDYIKQLVGLYVPTNSNPRVHDAATQALLELGAAAQVARSDDDPDQH